MSRRRNQKKQANKKSKTGKIALIIVLVVALIGAGAGGYAWYLFQPVSNDETTVSFTIAEGDDVAAELVEAGLIRSDLAFKFATRFGGAGDNFKAGNYDLSPSMSVYDMINKFVNGEFSEQMRFTIFEGNDLSQIAESISQVLDATPEEILKQIDDVDFIKSIQGDYWFLTDDIYNEEIKHPLEGYLYPDTYFVDKTSTVQTIVKQGLDNMLTQLEPLKADMQSSSHSINELMTMASIVEKETILDKDRPKVAGVFYNRIAVGMPLGSDVTVGYSLGKHDINYTVEELQNDSPYNTYVVIGLPPGPIASPALSAIKGALYPEENDYYYFIGDICTDNTVYYATTEAEHKANVDKYLGCYRNQD